MTDKLDSKTTLLASTGCLAVLGGFFAYRAKATRPFKLAYFVAWPTLGSAIILLAQPDKQSVEDKLRASGSLSPARLEEIRQANRQAQNALQEQAKKGLSS